MVLVLEIFTHYVHASVVIGTHTYITIHTYSFIHASIDFFIDVLELAKSESVGGGQWWWRR